MAGSSPDHNFHSSNTHFIVMVILMMFIAFGLGGLVVALGILGI